MQQEAEPHAAKERNKVRVPRKKELYKKKTLMTERDGEGLDQSYRNSLD